MLEEMQGFRLSPQQKHLWQLQEIDNLPYRSQCAVLIEGDLDVNILKLVLEIVVNRHEILRTNFRSLPGMTIPLQVIGKQKINWDNTYDLSSLTPQEQENSLTELFHKISQQPFDIVQASPLQLSLVTLSASKYVLIVSLPGLCADITTLEILVQEISQSYAAWLKGEEIENEALQYADLAEWQNELLEGAETEAGRDYWEKQNIALDLQGLKLPFEKQSADELVFKPQTQSFAIAPELIKQIDILNQYNNTSIFEFLLACWQILNWRLTKQENLTIGMAFAGRKYQEIETVVGLFSKYLPLTINIEATSKIKDIVYSNKKSIQQLDKIQDYFNWEQIAGLIQNNLRFFPLCFEFAEQPDKYLAADVSFTIYQQYTCIERFTLKLSCLRQDDTLTAELHYDSSVFQAEDIKRLIEQFQTLLASAIANPDATISELEVLSQIERHQLLYEVNNNQRDYPQTKCIHQLFEEQAQKTPDNIAIVFEDQQLTYAQLNSKVNQLAHYLQQQGVKAEVVVGLCTERTLEMMIGLLGILKAGGAYLPLDPTLPQGSLNLRLQGVQVDIILTQQRWLDILPTDAAKVICLDTDWEVIAQNKDENPSSEVTPENLVYVLFTSGSTGKPKGVAIAHQQLLNYVNAIIDRLNLPAGINFATVSTLAADLGNTVIFPALCTGGCLHLISYQRATDSAALAEYCGKHPIDCLKIVPSHLASLLASSSAKSILPRQRLILGGEVANWHLIEQIQHYTPDCLIFNHYGPTEACVGVCTLEIVPEQVERHLAATVPLGRSIANTQVYILEENYKLAPLGVKGEIYIGGAGLARCYLNQPDQTALKFIPHPYSDIPGARLYKTGDLGRYLPNGTIEFLGRIDNQVKIRGFRIELGEIEAVLNQYPHVREVVVLVRESESGQKYLAAFVVPSEESPCSTNELRGYIRDRLPEYMLPSTFIILKALPLTPNGKVDRQALLELNPVRPELETSLVTPRTPVEEVLAGIWIGLLGIERVGIHNNFFELGGHSLLATQVVSQVREAFQVEMRLRSLFEKPTIAGLAELIETTMRSGEKLEIPPIERVPRNEALPLSFAQQRLWFLDQLDPSNPFYNISSAILLKGSLNVPILEQSFQEIVQRHEALRTSFVNVNGEPVQVIAPALNITLPVVDLQKLSLEEREAETRRLTNLHARHSFDLTQSPLLQTTLLQLAEDEHILLFTIHHIVADAWSAGVLIREVAALYESFSTSTLLLLPNLPIQYADFTLWQRQWLQTEVRSSQMAYWKQQLGGNLPVLQLPSDRQRPAIQTFRGKKQSWFIPQTLSQALKSISQREAVTLFMTMLAAFKTLLYRYTSQTDILVGSPIANRNRSEIERLIGFFVNTLVLRTDLSGNPSFRELLRRIREVTLDAYTHQDLPFEQLVAELQPDRNLGHTPLFQVMFVLQNAPMETLKLSGLSLTPVEVDTEIAKFDLTLSLTDTAQGLIGVFEYNTDLFDSAAIARMQGHFQTLLEGIVANPDQQLSDLPILTQAEQQQLLVDWNDLQADYPKVCIHQLFEAQVERTPNAIAVVFADQQLTYQELNTRANQLAHHLQTLGVGKETLVGICVERSLEMIIGLLGILKAGGAYLPIDPAYPAERLAFMLEDAQVSVLLTQQNLLAALPQHQAQVVCLEKIPKVIADNPIHNATADNLAYVIYTSGSTGQPKGVQITHSAVVNFLSTMRLNPGLTQQDILLSVTTLSFDIAALELYLPLITGARLVIVSRQVATDATQLSEQLVSSGATVMQATPATWRLLLAAGWQGSSRLKILCGGEALDRSLADQLLKGGCQVWNLYGPTETTIWSAIHKVDEQMERQDGIVSIGRPIANTQFYILDPGQKLVPVGISGELHIGGAGLARGYLHRPELTAEKFISHPFQSRVKEDQFSKKYRLYKTGDLVRYRADGTIEFLGRIDHQVKVRGFRIELGEIEALLNQHPEVQTSVVVIQGDEPSDRRLVAYVVLQCDRVVAISELSRFLEKKLPSYMIPRAFVILEALPLTPNGKIDRRALPAFDPARPHLEGSAIAPRNPVEEVLAGIWQEVLGVEILSIYDNFFELGGHSLLATRVISRVKKAFEVDLPLRGLFESPTIARLAAEIHKAMKAEIVREIPPIQRVARDGHLPLSFAQQRLWLLEQLQPDSFMYNIPVAVRFIGSLNVPLLEQSLNEIVRRHEVLNTTFYMVDGQPFQAIPTESGANISTQTVTLPVLDLRDLPEVEREVKIQQLIIESAQHTFDLAQAPLMRCTVLCVGEQDHIVLFTIHHIVSDGWSMGIFIRELALLYEAFSCNKPSLLPELPIQYADFAVWQRQWLQGEVLETQLAYWKQQLGNNLPVMQLSDRPRTDIKTRRGASQTFVIPPQNSLALQTLSRQQGVTLFMTLLAGFQVLLQRYTNQDDIVIGTDVANRNLAETELLIGFFVNLLVLRTDLSGNPSFRELLGRVRQVALGAYAHQDLPFDELVKALQPERNLSNTPPLFQVLFVLQNAPMPPLELPGLTLSLLEIEHKVARFDLALFLTETEQGISGKWQYNSDLFDASTITLMTDRFQTLLNSIISQPDARIGSLEMLTEAERKQQAIQKKERKAFNQKKLIGITPQAVSLLPERLVKTNYLQSGQTFPLVIQPATDDIDLVAWAKTNQEFIQTELLKYGAILFRGFNVELVSEFESFAQTISPDLFGDYGDLPRTGEGGKVYGSTPYPPDKAILFHNESSHLHQWPLKIWFFCVQPAQQGGETPIIDCRKAYKILNTKLRERLDQKQLMYVRHYTNGLDVSWQNFFRTDDKSIVENYCRQTKIDFEWYDDNSLITRQVRPALAVHPKTNEPVFFNQIQLHHIAYLDPEVRESLLSTFGDKKLPRNVYYGDGTPIEDSVIAEINEVYQQSQTSFTWQKTDILMLDNMLTAHGRNPYIGSRKLVVAMAEMIQ
ncbi:amino acid adenylation domain-containing protein [Nostoc sp. C057]|uniref:non-ribosomal peptide synthetase n=1 Tax=Nostoc sp. C057 TaxID=2576903 RepID=UPI0015C40AC3|nr:non-ribosomal peptide synthetase [Nostoc sp. C057]QLE49536.1 amino acid adenylation domain-containing protein [Nostoc sp. C057]